MVQLSNILKAVEEYGWALAEIDDGPTASMAENLTAIGEVLGDIVPASRWQMTDVLRPTSLAQARPTSLSGKFGAESFPLHCDTAFWSVPCRYVLLACEEPGWADVATLLLDAKAVSFSKTERQLASQALFFVRNGRKSFYASILSTDREFIRLDPGCLEPLGPEGCEAVQLFSISRWAGQLQRVSWSRGTVLVIDNWRVLHSREAVPDNDGPERKLRRVLIR